MRFIQFRYQARGQTNLGIEVGDKIVDLVELGVRNLVDFLKGGDAMMEKAKSAVASGKFLIPKSSVTLTAPVTNPDKVICIGMNYKDHCEEQGAPVPTEPIVFNKFPSSIVGNEDPIPYPECTKELDWEVELALVIGKACKNVSESSAKDYIFGYTVAHDVSAREWQLKKNGGQWIIGKTMDGFCPLGPAVVTADVIGDPCNLNIKCLVNDVVKQDSNTNQLVFSPEQLVSWCSRFFTLLPGDLILTGTPPGVGVFRKPQEFLKKGDVVQCEVEKIGTIKNQVV